ncbi:hypothetical protein BDR04DRAFT_1164777 [Suillus decipiens]|nr:hypothetical protein BDR04DRAFT_1164777 [Suillus decipiens]
MHLQRCIRTHALCLLSHGFEEDLREAIQVVNARAEGTLRPHSPVAEVEASQATLTNTTFPPNPRSALSNLVGLLAAVQSASETTSTIVHDIQQSVETSREARQAITDIVNVLRNHPVDECTSSPARTVKPIHTIIQNQTMPPSYQRSQALSPESVKTWMEEHSAGLYELAPITLSPVVVTLLEFVPVAALGTTTSSSTEELIAMAEVEAHIPKDSHLIAKIKAVGKQHQLQSQDPAYSNVTVAPPLCTSTSNPDENCTCRICKGTGHRHKTCEQYHCVCCHTITPRHLSIYCLLLKGKDVGFPIKDFKHLDFYTTLAAWELEEVEKYAQFCQEQDEARAIENDYDEDGHFISDNPIYWANQDE